MTEKPGDGNSGEKPQVRLWFRDTKGLSGSESPSPTICLTSFSSTNFQFSDLFHKKSKYFSNFFLGTRDYFLLFDDQKITFFSFSPLVFQILLTTTIFGKGLDFLLRHDPMLWPFGCHLRRV